MEITQKIQNVVERGLVKRNRKIHELSKIGLTQEDYVQYIEYVKSNKGDLSSLYNNAPIFLSNSVGKSRAYFKICDQDKSIGIIGTCGEGLDIDRLGVHYWNVMLEASAKLVEHTASNILISGGLSWADHIAVELFIKNNDLFNLQLKLPCKFENGKFDELDPIGIELNNRHSIQSKKLKIDTLSNIEKAMSLGCDVSVDNIDVVNETICSKSDTLLIFSFGDGKEVKQDVNSKIFYNFLKKENRGLAFHYNLNDERMFTH